MLPRLKVKASGGGQEENMAKNSNSGQKFISRNRSRFQEEIVMYLNSGR